MERIDSPTERTTAATDGLLSLTAVGAVAYLQSQTGVEASRIVIWSWSFALIALAAALGAIYHGVALPEGRRRALWLTLTLSLATAVSLFAVGVVRDLLGPHAAQRALPVMVAAGALVFGVSRLFAGLFLVFLLYEGLALLAALLAYAWLAASGALNGAGWMAAGAATSLAAAGIQAGKRLNLKLVWEFDHNGLFHLVQTAALVFFCAGLSTP
jgi:hypothetical protein